MFDGGEAGFVMYFRLEALFFVRMSDIEYAHKVNTVALFGGTFISFGMEQKGSDGYQ